MGENSYILDCAARAEAARTIEDWKKLYYREVIEAEELRMSGRCMDDAVSDCMTSRKAIRIYRRCLGHMIGRKHAADNTAWERLEKACGIEFEECGDELD